MKQGKQAFIPKARLIQILGEHLIKDATIGLLELVKNSYDADATHVEIVMKALESPEATIIIRDNGCGMDTETFLTRWMNPAAGDKEQEKQANIRTPLGRLPLGEKGVGRFAAQQIGHILRLVSKVEQADVELLIELDWRQFDVPDKDLQDVEITYTERQAQSFQPSESGTIIEISHLKSPWTETEVEKISNALKRLKSPFQGCADFDVTLTFHDCPSAFFKYEQIESSDILKRAHYKLFGTVDENGMFEFEYHFFIPGYKERAKKGKLDLLIAYRLDMPKPLLCWGFRVHLYSYLISSNWTWLQRSNIAKADLEELSGVRVYRDGIRVFPYGEKGDDWLDLDRRNTELPSNYLIRNYTVIGLIEITQFENSLLKDKTNREGLLENTAFKQFRELVLSTIRVFEIERRDDIPEKKLKYNIQDELRELFDVLSNLVAVLSPDFHDAQFTITPQKIVELQERISQHLEIQQQERNLLFNLAGTGLAAERFTHEFARLVRGANDALNRLKNLIKSKLENPKVKKEVDIIYESLEALRNDIRLLGPMFYVKRVANEKELDIRQIIQNTLYLQEHWLKKESIQVDVQGKTFTVKMREGSCMQIFNNLIDNSIFWLSRKSELDRRMIQIILDSDSFSVFVSDSGSGVTSRYREKIFEPFFSMRGSDGRGLGLYIVKEILEEKNWDITLVSQEDYPEIELLQGASFKITFVEKTDE